MTVWVTVWVPTPPPSPSPCIGPDQPAVLLLPFAPLPPLVEATRSVAGIVLKNNIRAMHEQPIPVEILAEVKRQCLLLIGDPSDLIRATVGLLITALGCRLPGGPPGFTGLESWPALLPTLLQCIDNPSEHVVLGAFSSLQKVCEDSTHEMLQLEGVLPVVLPKLIQFLQHPLPKVRVHALSCLNQFVHHSNIGGGPANDELLFQALGIFDAFLQGTLSAFRVLNVDHFPTFQHYAFSCVSCALLDAWHSGER